MTQNKCDHFGPTTVSPLEDYSLTIPVTHPKTEEDFSLNSLTEVSLGNKHEQEDLELSAEAWRGDLPPKGGMDIKKYIKENYPIFQNADEMFLKEILIVHPFFANMDRYELGVFNRFTQSDIYFRALDKLKKRSWNKKRIARFMFKELERYREEASRFAELEHPL